MLQESNFNRDPQRLEDLRYDVLVIGGGINGAGVAWDAATRGLKVALIDKADFGSGASAGCFKIAHGGIRYLQHLDLRRLFESAQEQRVLRIVAPHLVHPFPFLIPCYGQGKRSKWFLKLGMLVYEALTFRRNEDVGESHRLSRHRVLSRQECLQLAPGLPQEGLTGGVVYYDCQMSNCERLTISVVRAAARAGAVVCNYVEAESVELLPAPNGSRQIDVVHARDRETGETYRVRADHVVNATGPWISKVLNSWGLEDSANSVVDPETPYSKGVQIVVPQFVKDSGVALETKYGDSARVLARGGRSYFVFPWRGKSLVGTTDSLSSKDPDDFSVSEAEIEELIDDLKGAYQLNSLSAKDVYFAFGGFRPLDRAIGRKLKKGVPIGNSAGVSRDDRIIDHAKPSTGKVRNLISVEGVKYTTFRSFAVKVVNMINRNSRIHNRRTRTHRDILPGGDTGNYSRYTERLHGILDQGFDSSVVDYLIENYGTDIEDVLVLASDRPELKELISKDPPCLGAEVVYLAQNEMVCHLSDIVLRRAGVGLTGCPQDDVLIRIAELAGAALGWTPERMAQEIQRTKADYARLGITA